jgi:hypothetical protein
MAPTLTFLGEQDGPPERVLKSKLSDLFGNRQNVIAAYLARAHYGDLTKPSICLGLCVTSGADLGLVEDIHDLFARQFNRAVHLDTAFLNIEQQAAIAKVCTPFYEYKLPS